MATTADAPLADLSFDEKKHIETSSKAASADSIVEPAVTSGPRRTPFATPTEVTSIPAPPALTTDQEEKYTTLLGKVKAWEAIPSTSTKDATTKELTDTERQWLSRECLLRYLRASSWDVNTANTRLQKTLTWRREYGVWDKLTPEYISIENETGKQWILGFDNGGRPCLYLNPSRQNTEKSDRQIEHLVFMMERCLDLLPAGQETLALLIDFKETRNGQGATIAQGRQTLSILQNHYPERLGRALLGNLPWHISAFMKIIMPFVDPITRQKIVFNQPMRDHVPAEQLRTSHGGDCEFEYDHSAYWPSLNALAKMKREAMTERWIKGGKHIGELEGYLKAALDVGVGGDGEKDVQNKVDGAEARDQGTQDMLAEKIERDGDVFEDAQE